MRNTLKTLALSLAALCVGPALHAAAAPPPLTLTCYNSGAVALTVPVTSLFFDVGLGSSAYFTVFTDITRFDDIVYDTFSVNSYDYCLFSADMRTNPAVVTLESTAASVGMGGTYTQLTFSYGALSVKAGAVKTPSTARPLTAEEKAKALAAFLARVPLPGAGQK